MATVGLDLNKWMTIFQEEAEDLRSRNEWRLEFDFSIDAENHSQGWNNYIRRTAAWFECTGCKRRWPSNKVTVAFHMRLEESGIVKMRPFRQNCKICPSAPMVLPDIDDNNIQILMANLVKKIKIKCYNEKPAEPIAYYEKKEVKSPHEPRHCEGCKSGVCSKDN